MNSSPLFITRNKQNALLTAIVVTIVLIGALYVLLKYPSALKSVNIVQVIFIFICLCLSILAWYRVFQKNQVLIALTETGVRFRGKEIKWEKVSSYYITERISDVTTRHLFIKLKDADKKLKIYLQEADIPISLLVDAMNVHAKKHGFAFLGISKM